jgi:hypothetical protein
MEEKTVKVHRGRVMQKLGLISVADLVRLAQKAGVPPLAKSQTLRHARGYPVAKPISSRVMPIHPGITPDKAATLGPDQYRINQV